MKDEIIDFICSNDFHFFFEKGYGNLILSMFFPRLNNSNTDF